MRRGHPVHQSGLFSRVLNGFALNVQENPLYEGDSKKESQESFIPIIGMFEPHLFRCGRVFGLNQNVRFMKNIKGGLEKKDDP